MDHALLVLKHYHVVPGNVPNIAYSPINPNLKQLTKGLCAVLENFLKSLLRRFEERIPRTFQMIWEKFIWFLRLGFELFQSKEIFNLSHLYNLQR